MSAPPASAVTSALVATSLRRRFDMVRVSFHCLEVRPVCRWDNHRAGRGYGPEEPLLKTRAAAGSGYSARGCPETLVRRRFPARTAGGGRRATDTCRVPVPICGAA